MTSILKARGVLGNFRTILGNPRTHNNGLLRQLRPGEYVFQIKFNWNLIKIHARPHHYFHLVVLCTDSPHLHFILYSHQRKKEQIYQAGVNTAAGSCPVRHSHIRCRLMRKKRSNQVLKVLQALTVLLL